MAGWRCWLMGGAHGDRRALLVVDVLLRWRVQAEARRGDGKIWRQELRLMEVADGL